MTRVVQLPLFPTTIRRASSWTDIFGPNISIMTHIQRRTRWESVKALIATDEDRLAIAMYEDNSACNNDGSGPLCKYCIGGWCDLIGLPVGYNPILKTIGMACCGVGYVPREKRSRRGSA